MTAVEEAVSPMVDEPLAGFALDRVVEAAKRMEQHEEVDRWEFADDVRDAVDEQAIGQNGFDRSARDRAGRGSADTGFNVAIDRVNSRLYDEGIISVGRQSIVGAYTTAKAWSPEDRVEGATYWAHHELRGRDYDGRRSKVLRRLVAQNQRGRVGPKEVRLWKSSQRTEPMTPFLDQVEKAVRGALLRKGAPWNTMAEGDRDAIARMMRDIGGEVARGEFGIGA